MLGRDRYKRKAVSRSLRELAEMYRKLSILLEIVEGRDEYCNFVSQRVFSVVLEEDLIQLIEECEEILITGLYSDSASYYALRARGETVLEETLELIGRKSWEISTSKPPPPEQLPLS